MGQREDRRRRVLREDARAAAPATRSQPVVAPNLQPYADEALVAFQPRVTDLIPKRVWGLLALLLFGLFGIAATNAIYLYAAHAMADTGAPSLDSIDLQGPGTIASWLSSMLLLLAAAAALLVYNTRRHKVDDYRGRYRLWLWMAGVCVAASLDVATGLHQLVQVGLQRLTDTALWGDGSNWWIGIAVAVGLLVGTRALVDMWSCREGVLFLTLAAVCYLVATINHLGASWLALGQHAVMVYSSVLLLGHFFVLYSFLLYARNIYLQAQGIVVSRARQRRGKTGRAGWFGIRRRRLRAANDEAGPAAASGAGGAGGKRPKATLGLPVGGASESPDSGNAGDEDFAELDEAELDLLTNPDVSKAERRRLRKKLRRQQQQQRRAA